MRIFYFRIPIIHSVCPPPPLPRTKFCIKFENNILMCFRLKRINLKTHWKWSKRKRIHIVIVWSIENASKWKRWPKISQAHVTLACALSSTYVTTCNSIVFWRSSEDSRKRIKTEVWTRIDRCVFEDNALAWTGPWRWTECIWRDSKMVVFRSISY